MIERWYCLNLVSSSAILAVTGKPFLPCRVRISLTPPRWRCVYSSRFQLATRSVGISSVTYCSLCEAWRAHWSSLEDWMYSLGRGLLVEIKATHLGMPPSDLLLAKQECEQLLWQGLIEPTISDWACQAFYVEKKRLVIDYQPLNAFLRDEKFPLPKIQSLFVHLQDAKIFSKFDLKAGFWQLGISPSDRPKTTFCILNAHYQWTVMPFGLKVAPSLFQKAMMM